MKGLPTLIKLRQRELDTLRRKMAGLEGQKRELQQASAALSQELLHEQELARKNMAMAGFFGGFAKRIQKRQDDIAHHIRKLDKDMEALAADISEAFGELKKLEIALENIHKRKQAEANRKDTILLDEIAGQQHRRKNTENA